jgi:hypothetical protein
VRNRIKQLLDHLVGAGEQCRRDFEAQRLGAFNRRPIPVSGRAYDPAGWSQAECGRCRVTPTICAVRRALPKGTGVRVNDVVIPRDAIAREVQYHPSRTPAASWQARRGRWWCANCYRKKRDGSRSIVNGAREGE